MSSVRMNISLPEETVKELSRDIEPRKRSRFIAEAVNEDNMQEEARIIAFVVKMDFKLYPEKCCYVLRSAGCRALDSAGKSSREDNWRELR